MVVFGREGDHNVTMIRVHPRTAGRERAAADPARNVPRLAHRSALAARPAPPAPSSDPPAPAPPPASPVAEKRAGPPGRHRAPKPRRRRRRNRGLGPVLTLSCYTLTAMTGALAHHLLTLTLL